MQVRRGLEQIQMERGRITGFLRVQLGDEPAVVAVSGGLDSDVVARLTCESVGSARLKLFTVKQKDMEARHLANARDLATDLGVPLVEISLGTVPEDIVSALSVADPGSDFRRDGLLDPNRMKCSVRTTILSAYQDRGYIVVGTSNRTEVETGFFLPFGDGVWHIGPIVHLYKTQVRELAGAIGVRQAVLDQPASAGFWEGQEDLEDLAFWLLNGGPIGKEREFNDSELTDVSRIRGSLTTETVDQALAAIYADEGDQATSEKSTLSIEVVRRLRTLTIAAKAKKLRPLGVRLEYPVR